MHDIPSSLLAWYDTHGRELPWRSKGSERPDPYHVWMSEIMLQQTTVATVKAYFEKFLKHWPSVNALAGAPLEDVMKEWAGLGYYARARNLHKCATVIVNEHDGLFPTRENALRALPGIGDYTAAAIASIAFGEHAVVVDGNVERVVSRLNRIEEELPAAKKIIKAATATITPETRAGDFAQAMMDLGATVCSPKKPKCLICPIQQFCAAQKTGDAETFPRKKKKKPKPTRRAVSFWITCKDQILLERRPDKGLLGGMPGLFSTPWIEQETFPSAPEIEEHAPVTGELAAMEGTATHTFTHFHLETKIYRINLSALANVEGGFWIPHTALNDVGLPTVFKKMSTLVL